MSNTKDVKRYTVSDNYVFATVQGEVVLLGIANDQFYTFNAVGSFLWDHLHQRRHNLDELVNLVTLHFDVTEAQCRPDLTTYLQN